MPGHATVRLDRGSSLELDGLTPGLQLCRALLGRFHQRELR